MSDEDRLARFQREAKVLASLNHTNIAQIHGIEADEDGAARALVLELVEGPTLADRIAQGPIAVDEALEIARQIADALEAAHQLGIIHRDLKPANIKVRDDGTVKVLDFGLAKALQPAAPDPNMSQSPTMSLTAAATQMGMVMGTAAYMAPEQAKAKPVDQRADVWAFGAVLFEMLSGQKPFVGDDVSDTLALVLKFEPEWDSLPAETPARIRRLIRACLQKDPKTRVRDIGDVRLAMDGVFETQTESPSAQVATPTQRVWQRPVPLTACALLVAAVSGFAGWTLQPDPPREVSRLSYAIPPGQQFRNANRPVLAVSPDGRRFVYNTTEGLYLRPMDTLEARLLPGTAGNIRNPAFSPDGQSLIYATRPEGLKRLALSGGAAVDIGRGMWGPSGLSWGVDGAILVSSGNGIERLPSDGGTPDVVIAANSDETFDSAQLLPDGDSLLMSVLSDPVTDASSWNDADIVVQSLTSGQRTVLIEGGSDARYVSSGHLVYALDDGLFAVAFDADTLSVSGGPVSVVSGVYRATATASANSTVTDDGTLFYLAGTSTSQQSLAWVDRAGRSEELVTIPPNRYSTPRLAPDGDRVLVVANGNASV